MSHSCKSEICLIYEPCIFHHRVFIHIYMINVYSLHWYWSLSQYLYSLNCKNDSSYDDLFSFPHIYKTEVHIYSSEQNSNLYGKSFLSMNLLWQYTKKCDWIIFNIKSIVLMKRLEECFIWLRFAHMKLLIKILRVNFLFILYKK